MSSLETLLYYVLFISVLAFVNYFMQRLSRTVNSKAEKSEEAPEAVTRKEEMALESAQRQLMEKEQRERERSLRTQSARPASPTEELAHARERVEGSATLRARKEMRERAAAEKARVERELREHEAVVPHAQVPASTAGNLRASLSGQRNLRQAVILMTVLGPCRAQEPHDVGR